MTVHRVFCKYCRSELTDEREISTGYHFACKTEIENHSPNYTILNNFNFKIFEISRGKDGYFVKYIQYHDLNGNTIEELVINTVFQLKISNLCLVEKKRVKALYSNRLHLIDSSEVIEENFNNKLQELIDNFEELEYFYLKSYEFKVPPNFYKMKKLKYCTIISKELLINLENITNLQDLEYLKIKADLSLYEDYNENEFSDIFLVNLSTRNTIKTIIINNTSNYPGLSLQMNSNLLALKNLNLNNIILSVNEPFSTINLKSLKSSYFRYSKHKKLTKNLTLDITKNVEDLNNFRNLLSKIKKLKIKDEHFWSDEINNFPTWFFSTSTLQELEVNTSIENTNFTTNLPNLTKLTISEQSNLLKNKNIYKSLPKLRSLRLSNSLNEPDDLKNVFTNFKTVKKVIIDFYNTNEKIINPADFALTSAKVIFNSVCNFSFLDKILTYANNIKFSLLIYRKKGSGNSELATKRVLNNIYELEIVYTDEKSLGLPGWIHSCHNLKKLKMITGFDRVERWVSYFGNGATIINHKITHLDISRVKESHLMHSSIMSEIEQFTNLEVLTINTDQIHTLQHISRQFPLMIGYYPDEFEGYWEYTILPIAFPHLRKIIVKIFKERDDEVSLKIVLRKHEFPMLEMIYRGGDFYKIEKNIGGYSAISMKKGYTEINDFVFSSKRKLIDHVHKEGRTGWDYISTYVYKNRIYGFATDYFSSIQEVFRRNEFLYDKEDEDEEYKHKMLTHPRYSNNSYNFIKYVKMKGGYFYFDSTLPILNVKHLKLEIGVESIDKLFILRNLKTLEINFHFDENFENIRTTVENFFRNIYVLRKLKRLSVGFCCNLEKVREGLGGLKISFNDVKLPKLKKLKFKNNLFEIGEYNDLPSLENVETITSYFD